MEFAKKDKFFKVFETLSLIIFLIIGASMMAAGNEMMSEVVYDFGFPLWSLIIIVLSSLILFFGFTTLLNVSAYLIPCIVFGIIYVCIKANTISTISPPTFSTDIPNLFFLMIGSVSYVCCNLVLSNKFLFTLGKNISKKQIKSIAIVVAFILTTIIGVVILSILMNDSLSLYEELPILHMAFMISKKAGYLFFSAILFSILTTLFAAQYSFHELLKTQNKGILFLISIPAFFILSLFGFSKIVKYLYPIIGGLGFLLFFHIRKLTPKTHFQKAHKKIHRAR